MAKRKTETEERGVCERCGQNKPIGKRSSYPDLKYVLCKDCAVLVAAAYGAAVEIVKQFPTPTKIPKPTKK